MSGPPRTGHTFQNVAVSDQSNAHFGDLYNYDSHYYGSEDPLALLPTVPEANVYAYEMQHKNVCLENTRVSLLKDIYEWVDNSERCLFWLCGLAGTGKSTVARTVARKYSASASFFFSRDHEKTRQARHLFTSIASQLARCIGPLTQHVRDAIGEDRDVGALSLSEQWRRLVLKPLSLLESTSCEPAVVIVIDALDECAEERDVRALVRLLAEATPIKHPRLRIFLTSRPGGVIRRCFNAIGEENFQQAALQSTSSVPDVTLFLEHEFADLDEATDGWPSEDAIRDLANKSNGLFIWAETALRYIKDGRHFANRRLMNLLADERHDISGPDRALCGIYNTVLQNAIPATLTQEETAEARNRLRDLLGVIVVAFNPLSTEALADILRLPKKEVYQTLQDVSAILEIPSDEITPIRIHHPSFRDFIVRMDLHRDIEFSVDQEHMHRTIAIACITLLDRKLRQDMCGMKAPDAAVDNNEANQHIATSVQYACLYWSYHIGNGDMQLRDSDMVHKFLSSHILYWLEALSWMGQLNYSILALANLESRTLAFESSELLAYLHDLKRFISYNRSIIEIHPLQIYYSAPALAPDSSLVKRLSDCDGLRYRVKRSPSADRHWGRLVQTLLPQADIKHTQRIVFSTNSEFMAVGLAKNEFSYMEEIHIWDVGTGLRRQILESDYRDFRDMAFFSNEQLVTASFRGDIEIWDLLLGQPSQAFEHKKSCFSSCFSSNGKYLASRTSATICVFEIQSERVVLLNTILTPKYSKLIALSRSGLQLATLASDGRIHTWDVTSGTVIKIFGNSLHSFVGFSPDLDYVIWKKSRTLQIEDTVTGKEVHLDLGLSEHFDPRILAFSLDGKQLAVAQTRDMIGVIPEIRVFDVTTGDRLITLEGYNSRFTSLGLSPDKSVLVSSTEDGATRIWDLSLIQEEDSKGEQESFQPLLSTFNDAIKAITFSSDGTQFATLSTSSRLTFWNAATCERFQVVDSPADESPIEAMAFSWGSELLFLAGRGEVYVFDIATSDVTRKIKSPRIQLSTIAVCRAGARLALGPGGSTTVDIPVLFVSSGEVIGRLRGHSDKVTAMAFNDDGSTLASASLDYTVRLWSIQRLTVIWCVPINSIVHTLAFPLGGTGSLRNGFTALSDKEAHATVQCPKIFFHDEWIRSHGRGISRPEHWFPTEDRLSGAGPRVVWLPPEQAGQRVVWLPPEHRPTVAAAFGNTAIFGFESGKIGLWEIEDNWERQAQGSMVRQFLDAGRQSLDAGSSLETMRARFESYMHVHTGSA